MTNMAIKKNNIYIQIIIESMKLEFYTIPNEGHFFSFKSTLCFTIGICLELINHKASILLNWGASTYFLDEKCVKSYSILLRKKTKYVNIEVIDDHLLFFRNVIHKTFLTNVENNGNNSFMIFIINRSLFI